MAKGLVSMTKMTVSVGGDETHARRPLHREVLRILREFNVAGATLTKGVMSFGVGRRIHSDMDEMTMANLPIIIEAVDERARVEPAAERIARILGEHGLVQLQPTMVARRTRGAGKRREG